MFLRTAAVRSIVTPYRSIRMVSTRTETDAFGPVEVQTDKYWGAQTQRSLGNFNINLPQERMPEGVVRAFGVLKGAAATVNMRYGLGKNLWSPPRTHDCGQYRD